MVFKWKTVFEIFLGSVFFCALAFEGWFTSCFALDFSTRSLSALLLLPLLLCGLWTWLHFNPTVFSIFSLPLNPNQITIPQKVPRPTESLTALGGKTERRNSSDAVDFCERAKFVPMRQCGRTGGLVGRVMMVWSVGGFSLGLSLEVLGAWP